MRRRPTRCRERGRTTIVVPATNAPQKPPGLLRPLLRKGDGGLTKDLALCHRVRVVDRLPMRKKLGALSSEALRAVRFGLAEILDLGA
jgi:mRNA-degrading endonuclease toxin of MazEF toxin-antitoxin module